MWTVLPITTGIDGNYLFNNLPEGDYVVSVKAPEGYLPTKGGADVDDASNTDSNYVQRWMALSKLHRSAC